MNSYSFRRLVRDIGRLLILRRRFSAIGLQVSVLMFLSIGCRESIGPAEPPVFVPTPPATPTPAPDPPAFPPLSRAGVIYIAPDSLYSFEHFGNYHGSNVATRYVLYDNGEFALQFASVRYPFFEYTGQYSGTGTPLTFTFGEPRWSATGILRGDSLTISYNLDMAMSDFVSGVYIRSPGQ